MLTQVENNENNRTIHNARLLELDILRAVVTILLLLHHGGLYVSFQFMHIVKDQISFYILGGFIFIAGYLSVRSVARRGLPNFFLSKMLRIYIPYLVALALFIWMGAAEGNVNIPIHILALQSLLAPRFTEPIITIWFVSLILFFYALFGIVQKTIPSLRLQLIAWVGLFVLMAGIRFQFGLIDYRLFYYYFVYAAGVFCAQNDLLERLLTPRYFMLDKLGIAAGGILLYSLFKQPYGSLDIKFITVVPIYILSMVLLSLSLARWLVRREIGIGFFSKVALASYFAYLLHRPVWKVMLLYYVPPTIFLGFLYISGLGAFLTLLCSYWLQKVYNQTLGRIPGKFGFAR